jgi:uncharacterized protein (TIGR00269 family)
MEDKKFMREFENRVKKTIKEYKLLSREKILVACSGGKDSTTILYLLKKLGYDVEAITINAFIGNYSKENLDNLVEFCKKQDIMIHQVSFKEEFGATLLELREIVKEKGVKINSCALCGVLKRYLLNKKSRELGVRYLVTGHNLDDVAQSFLMNLLRNQIEMSARLGPISGIVEDKKFVKRVKPLYFTPEEDVAKYSKLMHFPVSYGRCPCSVDAYRNSVRQVLFEYKKSNPKVNLNMVNTFVKRSPKKKDENMIIETCSNCGEPSKGNICRTCSIIEVLQKHLYKESPRN